MRPLYISVGAWGCAVTLLVGAVAMDRPPAVVSLPRPERAVEVRREEEKEITDHPMENELIEAALVTQGYFREDVPLSFELQDFLQTACEANGVPYHAALGLIEVESGFNPRAVNPVSGCYGLCQLNPNYFPGGLSPAENVTAGMEYLGDLLEKYGDLPAALTAYHAGHDTGWRGYANAVLEAAEKWE